MNDPMSFFVVVISILFPIGMAYQYAGGKGVLALFIVLGIPILLMISTGEKMAILAFFSLYFLSLKNVRLAPRAALNHIFPVIRFKPNPQPVS